MNANIQFSQTPLWQRELARAIKDPKELLGALGLDPALLGGACAAAARFPLRVPWGYVARMQPRNPADPLLRQVLPLEDELYRTSGFGPDPVGDAAAMVAPGVLHKYYGRVLLTVTGACAIHCRYCFRRHFPYAEANPAADDWREALAYVAADKSIREVILSGGDPLTLSDARIAALLGRIAAIAHVQRLRIHTRLPVVLPERITPELLDVLRRPRFKVIVVIHANHANEIDDAVRAALAALNGADATVLNQTVLLRGVNDSTDALCALSEALFSARVLPYYLHLLDRVEGAAHFEADEMRARRLWNEINARLPGYLVPRLVRETAGAAGKDVGVW